MFDEPEFMSRGSIANSVFRPINLHGLYDCAHKRVPLSRAAAYCFATRQASKYFQARLVFVRLTTMLYDEPRP